MSHLALREKEALDACERKIERGLATFVEVGRALAEIRDRRYYRETHDTFEAYCQQRWNFSRPHAYRLIEAAEVASPIGDIQNEAQARELAPVPEEDRADVWAEANERTDGKPTAAAIRDVRNERYPQTPRAQDELPPEDDQVGPGTSPAVEDHPSPAPSVTPSEAVTEYLNGSQSVQDAKYMHAFAKAIARADDFLRFDAERVGRLCDNDDVVSVQHLLDFTEEFLSRMRKARTGLRVVNGGRS